MVTVQLKNNGNAMTKLQKQREMKTPNLNEKPERRKDPGASLRREQGGELVGRSRSRMMLETRRRTRMRTRETWNGKV